MADWTYTPEFPLEIRRLGPPTLISTFEDGTEVRREKTTAEVIEYVHQYNVSKTDMDAMLDFYETKYLDTTFTIVSFEAEEAGAHEATVRFAQAPAYVQFAPTRYRVTITFVKVN